jgi:prepilin-type N-terminal cleavage/methylation domain-containing protein
MSICRTPTGYARAELEMSLIRRTISKSGGFTLVEVLAAVLLLSIALLAIMTANTAARGAQQRAVCQGAARNVAQSVIDQLRAAPIDSISTMAFPASDASLPSGNSIAVSVTGYPTLGETNLYKATVTVSWPEGVGTRSIQYEMLITRR